MALTPRRDAKLSSYRMLSNGKKDVQQVASGINFLVVDHHLKAYAALKSYYSNNNEEDKLWCA